MPVLNSSKKNIIYQDISKMLIDIRSHMKKIGNFIIPCDDQKKLLLGYRCTKTNFYWKIDLRDLRRYPLSNFIMNFFQSETGRTQLIKELEEMI